jgi:seryl-tRNA synthetase
MADLDLVDTERGVKVSGFRGYFLKNEGFLLAIALWNLTLEKLLKSGFTPMEAPAIAKGANLVGTGWLPQGKDEVYKIGDDEYLAGTAEVTMMGYHAGEVLLEKDLPKKYIAFSPCFRSEAGSYGKDTKGILRVHEFMKMEQVVLCKNDHDESVKWHEEITKNAEEIVRALELPYRVVVNCAGDLGLGQVKKYDIECWLPSQNKYRETHSASYFHDFQTRRLNIRYRTKEGQVLFTHSLNNTALATPRILAQIVENYQTKKGTVIIPKVLHKYMFGIKEIKKRD